MTALSKSQPAKRAAIYARFSTVLQDGRSIDDQYAYCSDYAARIGIAIVDKFSDEAMSSATLKGRDGLAALLACCERGAYDAVVVEQTDRLSRDAEDLHHVAKRLEFAGVELHLVNNGGVANFLDVGVRALLGPIQLKAIADNERRRKREDAKKGLTPGGRAYGYRAVVGKENEREIDEPEAVLIRRMLTEYADGKSPRAIMRDLTLEGVPCPGQQIEYNKRTKPAAWNMQFLLGGGGRPGVISNPIYIGKVVYGRTKNVRNPKTGKMVKRAVPESEWIISDAPHLRIIDQDLWNRVQAMRKKRGVNRVARVVPVLPRTEYILVGLLRCGVCGGHMRIEGRKPDGTPLFACAAAVGRSGACDHKREFNMTRIETAVFARLKECLLDPEMLAQRARGYKDQMDEETRKYRGAESTMQKQLDEVRRRVKQLQQAIIHGEEAAIEGLMDLLNPLERERQGLEEQLRLLSASRNVIAIGPGAIERYRRDLIDLAAAFHQGGDSTAIRQAFSRLIDSVVIYPVPVRKPYDFAIYGRLAALLGGVDLYPSDGGNDKGTNGTLKSCTVNTAKAGAQDLAKRWVPASAGTNGGNACATPPRICRSPH